MSGLVEIVTAQTSASHAWIAAAMLTIAWIAVLAHRRYGGAPLSGVPSDQPNRQWSGAILAVRYRLMNLILRGLRFYTRCSPFRRGRGAFIRPIEVLKRGGWPAPLVTADCGVKMEFEPSLLGWTVFERGAWEPEQSALVLSLLHSGGVVVNVGANTGYYALLAAAAVGPTGQVHAFEIQPEILKVLTRNVAHNDFEGTVYVVAAGCWSSVGEATIEPHGDPGSARIAFGVDGVRVPLTTIDGYVAACGLERVDLILIDTEGADFEVLKGAAEVLKRFLPIVMAEAHHLRAFGSSEDEMRAYMAACGYSARAVDSEFSRDLLFLPRMEPTALPTGPRT